jgi:hypothetical protein
MDQYLLIFPRAKSIWAYEHQAPGVGNGAENDQRLWETDTRNGRAEFADLTSPTGKKFAMWVNGTYKAEKQYLTVDELRGKVEWMESHFFDAAFEGEDKTKDDAGYYIPLRVDDPHTGLVREYYSWLVRLTQNKKLPEEERPRWVAKKHQAIRLLYYKETVAPRFTAHYHHEIVVGYQKMGMTAPDYSKLDRKTALAAIRTFVAKVHAQKNPPAESADLADLLEKGLENLNPTVILDGYV